MLYRELFLNDLDPHWNGSDPAARVQLYLQQPNAESGSQQLVRPCIVICPGGGYHFTSEREAEPVALRFAAHGYQVAVVRYSVAPYAFPTALCEVSLVMAYLRRNAETLAISSQRIAVCGFSAGGHLAASLANLWQLPFLQTTLGFAPEQEENRPNAAVLCYPVITNEPHVSHRGSFDNLLAGVSDVETIQMLSLEHSVNTLCSPTFLWHTANDDCVPVENTLLYAGALRACKIPFELHIYPEGPHGIALADATTAFLPAQINPRVATWVEDCLRFLEKYCHPISS